MTMEIPGITVGGIAARAITARGIPAQGIPARGIPARGIQAQGGAAHGFIEFVRRATTLHKVAFEGTDPFSVRVSSEAVEELVQSLSARASGSVQQIVPFAPARLAGAFTGRIWRHLAKRLPVERFYLVPSGEDNLRLAEDQVAEDRSHDMISCSLPVSQWNSMDQVPMSTLWLIDNRVVVRREPTAGGLGSWLVTERPAELDRARQLLGTLRDRADGKVRPEPLPAGPDITQWLLESAELVHKAAQMSCASSHWVDEDGCSWYHGAWQYLRFLDMVSSPTWHADFYAGHLRRAIHERKARRILISGTADWTMLAFVLEAAKDAGGEIVPGLEIHVADLCPTPLMASGWYARRCGVRLKTHRTDFTRLKDLRSAGLPMGAFDLVVTDAFLTRFEARGAERVLQNWYKLLRPGGSVVTTVRLHSSNEYPDRDGFDAEFDDPNRVTDPVDDFELRLRERAAVWQDMLAIDLEDLSRAGRQYAKRMVSHDLGGAEEITAAFTGQHFSILENAGARVPGELVGTEYLRVTAQKPDPLSAAGATQD